MANLTDVLEGEDKVTIEGIIDVNSVTASSATNLIIKEEDYAESTKSGVLKARYDIATQTLYLRNDGVDA